MDRKEKIRITQELRRSGATLKIPLPKNKGSRASRKAKAVKESQS